MMTKNKRFVPDEQGFVYDIETMGYVPDIFKLLNELYEEKEIYKTLWEEMAYYFQDDGKVNSLNDLDHKDFRALQRLSKGLVD